MEEKKYLGTGIKFPPQASKSTGRFLMAQGEDSVKESVYLILMTQKNERWLHPDFGSNILSYTFMDTSVTRLHMIAKELEQTILEQEPRISRVEAEVTPKPNQGCLIIHISYEIAETHTRDSFVFPFYLY